MRTMAIGHPLLNTIPNEGWKKLNRLGLGSRHFQSEVKSPKFGLTFL